jgi:glycosyltransferase involved in cell wall biosynthesis
MSQKLDISVIIPAYNEEESLPELNEWISRVMQKHGFTYEILLVDDGSTDGTWSKIAELSRANPNLKGLKFNRNHGKSAALNTGFKYASGDVVITMDADLQDSPDEIPELYEMVIKQDFDLVSGWKKKRRDPIGKTIPSRFFNLVTRKISGIKLHDFNCGLKAYKNIVVRNIRVYGEMHRYIPVICKWHGFGKIGEKVVQHQARKYGVTKFGFERFITGFLDLISVTFVSKFRKKPMHFFGTLGSLSFLSGFFIAAYIIFQKIWNIYHHETFRDATDQPLFYIALVAIILGVQLFLAGFLAEMYTMANERNSDYLLIDKIGL